MSANVVALRGATTFEFDEREHVSGRVVELVVADAGSQRRGP